MRAISLLVAVAACADDPARLADRYIGPLNDIIAHDGPPAFDLGALSAAGPPASPALAGGGVGSPEITGGLGSPVHGGVAPPSGAGGGIAPGPSGIEPDQTIVALACELFDALFDRVARCSGDSTGVIAEIDQLFQGETCQAYVEGILRIDPEPITPEAIQIVRCFTALLRDTPCDATGDAMLQQCVPQ